MRQNKQLLIVALVASMPLLALGYTILYFAGSTSTFWVLNMLQIWVLSILIAISSFTLFSKVRAEGGRKALSIIVMSVILLYPTFRHFGLGYAPDIRIIQLFFIRALIMLVLLNIFVFLIYKKLRLH